ncbi:MULTISPECIES: DUF374 domain-containing protein [Prosthecochloris]|uniref:DUF374 domain-containing protein n=1 Tax=Prosthecochloris vibrioformis TaxID=1098 RepID=A0A5C4S020_PROVB|nr:MULTISPECIES: DUF374 domain-containing protein [Prosthecochloris]ANT64306.1 hypothetical protein Ptc2401_00507 [Prosthecochloris sp. CIB 2401]TNJ36724.1 DUF374 domain-containing protein [Prosthecochloris vibrioformis]
MQLLPALARHLLPPLLKLLYRSLRITITGPGSDGSGRSGGLIVAFWHGKMVAGWMLVRHLFPEKKNFAVVSMSEDGQILAAALEKLEFGLIRGSSSRGGSTVRRMMEEHLTNGSVVAVTPDGPRGPLHSFKYGTLSLASEAGIPILFIEITYNKARMLRSWDRFEIPMPFSRAEITLHEIQLPRFGSREELEIYERHLKARFSHD